MKTIINYCPFMSIIVSEGTSAFGLGAVISYQLLNALEKSIVHSSHTSTPAENYSQIEKEALALVFAVSRSHKFLYS